MSKLKVMNFERRAELAARWRHQEMQHRFTRGPDEMPDVVVQVGVRFNTARWTPRGWARFLRRWRHSMLAGDRAPWRRGTWQ